MFLECENREEKLTSEIDGVIELRSLSFVLRTNDALQPILEVGMNEEIEDIDERVENVREQTMLGIEGNSAFSKRNLRSKQRAYESPTSPSRTRSFSTWGK